MSDREPGEVSAESRPRLALRRPLVESLYRTFQRCRQNPVEGMYLGLVLLDVVALGAAMTVAFHINPRTVLKVAAGAYIAYQLTTFYIPKAVDLARHYLGGPSRS